MNALYTRLVAVWVACWGWGAASALLAQTPALPTDIRSTTCPRRGCATDDLRQRRALSNPAWMQAERAQAQQLAQFRVKHPHDTRTTYVLPVVIHVMHLPGTPVGTAENVSDEDIRRGMELLNDAYRNRNAYAEGPTVATSSAVGVIGTAAADADIEIEFALALRAPDGTATTGISRHATALSDLYYADMVSPGVTQDSVLKNIVRWDPAQYINVYLVNSICRTSSPLAGCEVDGYAFLPFPMPNLNIDGITLQAQYWNGKVDDMKLAAHEFGHYLGLLHTFEGGCTQTDCLTQGDFQCDTPPNVQSVAAICGQTTNTCASEASLTDNDPYSTDVDDLYQNYMDYSPNFCINSFTAEQRLWMRDVVSLATAPGPFRTSLLASTALTPVQAPVSDFTAYTTTACAGGSIAFRDRSLHGPTTWAWSFPGGSPSSSASANPVITYPTPGTYAVTLTTSNGLGSGTTMTKTAYVLVAAAPATACVPAPASSPNGTQRMALANVESRSGLANAESPYMDFSCSRIAELQPQTSYALSLTFPQGGGSNAQAVKVFIDYNNDGDFDDADELAVNSGSTAYLGGPNQFTLTTPAAPLPNTLLRMRVISAFAIFSTGCFAPATGQVEDYGVVFRCTATAAPVAHFAASSTLGCPGLVVQYEPAATGCPASYAWSFPGGTPSTSTALRPSVTYATPGTYTATLTVSNSIGSHTASLPTPVVVSAAPAVACAVPSSGQGPDYGVGLRQVAMGTLNSLTPDDEPYQDLTCTHMARLVAGQTYPLTFNFGSMANPELCKIFFDYNNDGDFDDTGEYYGGVNGGYGGFTANVAIPTTATTGSLLRMRLITLPTVYGTPFASFTACTAPGVGQAEDYGIYLEPALPALATGSGCISGNATGVSGTGWVNITDGGGNLIAAINPQGQNLGTVTAEANDMASVPEIGGIKFLPRYWNFEASNAFANAVSVRLYFSQSELDAYNTAAGSSIAASGLNLRHYSGTQENCDPADNAANGTVEGIDNTAIAFQAIGSGAGAMYQASLTLPHFSEVGMTGSSFPLPIEWGEVAASWQTIDGQEVASLSWSSLRETNVHHFEVQRSTDAAPGSWQPVGQQAAAGTTDHPAHYALTDPGALPAAQTEGQVYYRIQAVDVDGSIHYAPLVALQGPQGSGLPNDLAAVAPNPFTDALTIAFLRPLRGPWHCTLYTLAGQPVLRASGDAAVASAQLATAHLPHGLYLLEVADQAGQQRLKVVK